MRVSFQRRLFRHFLIASISPIILISIVGYYLMTEISNSGTVDRVSNSELAEYYNNLIFARITSSIKAYGTSEPSDLSASLVEGISRATGALDRDAAADGGVASDQPDCQHDL